MPLFRPSIISSKLSGSITTICITQLTVYLSVKLVRWGGGDWFMVIALQLLNSTFVSYLLWMKDLFRLFKISRTSLVAQWLRIHLPMQGTQVQSLVREDPTCCRATKPVHHNYWACALEPASHNYWTHVLQLLKPPRLQPVLHNKRSHLSEKPAHCNEE